jgi:hypothetical protein
MRGGTVIGQGTYGCAVVPPLLCKGSVRQDRKEGSNAKDSKKTVGKLTLMMDAETELSISKILRGEKLWKNYFILPELNSCQPVEATRAENWGSCGITSQYKPNQLRQLVSEFGGKSFSSLGATNLRPGIFDFFFFMRHTLEATALLTLNGVVHYDLHRSNILIDNLGVPRLLDFGMAFDAKNITDQVLNDRWKQYDPKYDSEPPEITVITGIRKGMNLEAAIRDCVYGKPVFKTYELIFGVPRTELVAKLHRFLKNSRSFEKRDWVTFFQTYWPGLDSFALGAALLHILQTQLTWPSFVQSENWQKNENKINKVLQHMVAIDPSERFDCVEALNLLDPENVVLKNNASWLAAREAQRQE